MTIINLMFIAKQVFDVTMSNIAKLIFDLIVSKLQ
jgi:hypothetical protein